MCCQGAINLAIKPVFLFFCPVFLFIVSNYDGFSAKLLSILHLGHKRAPSSFQEQKETLSFDKMAQFWFGEVVPHEWITTLAILLEGADNLTEARSALLDREVAHV